MESILYDSKNSQTYKFGLHILDYVPKDKSQSIIDIGSGSGALTHELTYYGGNVIGIDKSIRAIEGAKRKYPTVPFYIMDATRLQYENRFDIAFSNATFQEIEDKKKLLTSIYKCLKTGGKLIAEFASKKGNIEYFDFLDKTIKKHGLTSDAFKYYLIEKESFVDLLEEVGFEIEHLEEYSRKTFVRGNDESVKDLVSSTISRNIDKNVREEIISELMEECETRFKSTRGWMKDVCRLRLVAIKK